MQGLSRRLTLVDETDRLTRNVGNYHPRCVTSLKIKDLTPRRKTEHTDTTMLYLLLPSNILQYVYLYQINTTHGGKTAGL
jgi:hypothetical protein